LRRLCPLFAVLGEYQAGGFVIYIINPFTTRQFPGYAAVASVVFIKIGIQFKTGVVFRPVRRIQRPVRGFGRKYCSRIAETVIDIVRVIQFAC
jgi:hypothetical protein